MYAVIIAHGLFHNIRIVAIDINKKGTKITN